MASLLLLRRLADALVAQYETKPGFDVGNLPQVDDLVPGLRSLIGLTDLKDRALDLFETNAKGLLPDIEKAVRDFQQRTGLLKIDGILGGKTLKNLLMNSRCLESDQALDPAPAGIPHDAIRYYIHSIPPIGADTTANRKRALKLFRSGLVAWQHCIDFPVEEVESEDEANVVVMTGPLPTQPPAVLALASIGPPRGRVLKYTFDITESWTDDKFLATATHEWGHILGIRHLVGQPGALMYDVYQPGITKPTKADCIAARSFWPAAVDDVEEEELDDN